VRDIAEALDYAHRQGVVPPRRQAREHPAARRRPRACCRTSASPTQVEAQQSGLTREGTSVGTPHYMSPEQLRGEHGDGRSDLYSLGVVFYQLLTGELPYQGNDGWAIGIAHMTAEIPRLPPPPRPPAGADRRLLAKDPIARLQSGAEWCAGSTRACRSRRR
jgi:serine/threonine-protein kinase PpkA